MARGLLVGTWLIVLKICNVPLLTRMPYEDPLCKGELFLMSLDY